MRIVRMSLDAGYLLSLSGAVGLYAALGSLRVTSSSYLTGAVFGLTSILYTRKILWTCEKENWVLTGVAGKVSSFAYAFLGGSLMSAFLTTYAAKLPISFIAGIVLQGVVLCTVLTVISVAFSCLLCSGAAIGVQLLPE